MAINIERIRGKLAQAQKAAVEYGPTKKKPFRKLEDGQLYIDVQADTFQYWNRSQRRWVDVGIATNLDPGGVLYGGQDGKIAQDTANFNYSASTGTLIVTNVSITGTLRLRGNDATQIEVTGSKLLTAGGYSTLSGPRTISGPWDFTKDVDIVKSGPHLWFKDTGAGGKWFQLETAGGNFFISASNGAGLLGIYGATGRVLAFGELEIDGAFNHDGSTVAFFNQGGAARQNATLVNVTAPGSGITDPAAAPANATVLRDDLVANTIPSIEAKFTTLASNIGQLETRVNALINALDAYGLVNATS